MDGLWPGGWLAMAGWFGGQKGGWLQMGGLVGERGRGKGGGEGGGFWFGGGKRGGEGGGFCFRPFPEPQNRTPARPLPPLCLSDLASLGLSGKSGTSDLASLGLPVSGCAAAAAAAAASLPPYHATCSELLWVWNVSCCFCLFQCLAKEL